MTSTTSSMPPVSKPPEAEVRLSIYAKSSISLTYMLLLFAGILGNAMVIRVLWGLRRRRVQASLSHHMCSLASCDLLQLVLGIPAELYGSIWSPFPWPLGNIGCCGFYYLWEVLCYAAIFNVLSLSCERHLATCRPLSLHLRQSSVRLRLCFIWLMSLLAGLPVLFTMGLEDVYAADVDDQHTELWVCTPLSSRKGLFVATIWASFLTYLGVLSVVGITCWRMRRALQGSASQDVEVAGPGGSVQLLGRFCSGQTVTARKQNARMLGCIVGALAVCWLPFQARRLMTVLRSKDQWTENYYRSYITLQPITNCFYYLSSCLTPLLYNLTSQSFRRAFVHGITHCAWGTTSTACPYRPQPRDCVRMSAKGQNESYV
ncbi:hypothetical protein XENTR_v10003657 [Xenopus tropicalis]|uniref:G-protein coupled receptor 39 n=1 Tax=Xenopus tropicalis TaxID=8364 RepID=A0A6I8RPP0_XENTR|eukprot:XP_004918724.1 PREDICTED: G-protein coupled receptor 39-like [Xenopus tropicalis]